jgi:hypothetical protein
MSEFYVSVPNKESQWFFDQVILAVKDLNNIVFTMKFRDTLYDEYDKSNLLEGELSSLKHKNKEAIYSEILACNKDLAVKSYWAPFGAIGKTYGDGIIWVNRAKTTNLKYLASLLLHEMGHDKLGAKHDWNPTKRRPNSLCYMLNRVYEQTYDEIFGEEIVIKRKPLWRRIFG